MSILRGALPWLAAALLAALGLWLLLPPAQPENVAQEPTSASTRAPAAPRPPTASPAPTQTATAELQAQELVEGEAAEELTDGAGEQVDPTAAAVPATAEQADLYAQALDVAERAAAAYARPAPGTDPATWWAGVEPLLADRAAADYAGTDPAVVRYAQVTGAGQVLPSGAPMDLLTIVGIPTDVGLVRVELERGPDGWQVTYFDLPDQVAP